MVESHFENIDREISKILLDATKTIDIASAWLTHRGLMKILETQAQINSVKIRIIISNDAFNKAFFDDYYRLMDNSVCVYIYKGKSEKNLMHNKFAVVDSVNVITGSFNWTKSAETNLENIVVSKGNPEFAGKFIKEFERICDLSNALKRSDIVEKKNLTISALSEDDIWSFLRYFHQVNYNPTPQRIWRGMRGTQSKSIRNKLIKAPFYSTIKNYGSQNSVLDDLESFFVKYAKEISDEFKYEERGWKNISFPGKRSVNSLTTEQLEIIKKIPNNRERSGQKWNNQELDLLAKLIIQTNDVEQLSKMLNRSSRSIIKKAQRILYEDKNLYRKWLDTFK